MNDLPTKAEIQRLIQKARTDQLTEDERSIVFDYLLERSLQKRGFSISDAKRSTVCMWLTFALAIIFFAVPTSLVVLGTDSELTRTFVSQSFQMLAMVIGGYLIIPNFYFGASETGSESPGSKPNA